MAQRASTPRPTGEPVKTWVLAAVIYAAILLMMAGIFQAFEGLAAILNGDFYPPAANNPFSLDVTVWGWIHLGVGVVVAVAGFNVLSGGAWARVIGIGVATVSAINNFLFLPHHPVWSVLIIALDVVAIWALCVYAPPRGPSR